MTSASNMNTCYLVTPPPADDIYKLRHLMFDMYFNWLTDREQGVKTHNTSSVDVVSV